MTFSAFALVFLLAFSVTIAMVPAARWFSYRLGAISRPGGRRHERQPMARLGGLALYAGFVTAIIAAESLPVPRHDPEEIIRLTGLLLGVRPHLLAWSGNEKTLRGPEGQRTLAAAIGRERAPR